VTPLGGSAVRGLRTREVAALPEQRSQVESSARVAAPVGAPVRLLSGGEIAALFE
jgi:hypothetical protein